MHLLITSKCCSLPSIHLFYPFNVDLIYFRVNSNANTDLLGLSTPPSNNVLNNSTNSGTLIDVLGDIYGSTNNNTAVYNSKKFLFKNNGVLFENEMLQIGVKSEFRQNLGRLGLFYGNKTQIPLTVSGREMQFKCEAYEEIEKNL